MLWDLKSSQQIARYPVDRLQRSHGEFLGMVMTNEGVVLSCDIRQQLMVWDGRDGSVQKVISTPNRPGRIELSA